MAEIPLHVKEKLKDHVITVCLSNAQKALY